MSALPSSRPRSASDRIFDPFYRVHDVVAAQIMLTATLTRDEILNEVWGSNSMPSTRTVDVHVAWLRQKIEPNPRHPQFILTVHGMGYKFAA